MKTKKRETAAEFMARLHSDPEWVRKNAEREARTKALEARFDAEERPILNDLAEVGCTVSSVWDLVNSSASYPHAIPVLLKHLQQPYHPRILEGIVRALTVKEARGAPAHEILDELKRRTVPSPSDDRPAPEGVQGMPRGDVRWALANALTVVADASMINEIKALVRDDCYQDMKERLETALKNLGAG
jgi:hypothetical protein